MCFIDYDRQMALVAIEAPRIVAVARLIKLHGTRDAEFAIVISDDCQRLGLGTELMSRLARVARDEGLGRLIGYISATNWPMIAVCKRLGFRFTGDATTRLAVLDL
jgi:acetyltransferase